LTLQERLEIKSRPVVNLQVRNQANPGAHECRAPMSQESVDPTLNNSNLCEAAGCFAKATMLIEVKVGEKGNIPLMLCSKCVIKFEDTDTGCVELEETG